MSVLAYPVNALVSFHYYKDLDISELARGGLRMIGDSGAFSAFNTGSPVDIGEFAEWTKRWRGSLTWVASLDVIYDADRTWRNFRTLRDRYGLDVVPTIHYGADPHALDRYAAEGVDMIGLGGMVGRKSQPKHLLRWCLSVFRYQRDHYPGMRFHGWGVTHPALVHTLPWYSVDSSGTSAAYRYGRLTLYDPTTHKMVEIRMDGQSAFHHATFLRKHYGVRPAEIASSSATTRPAIIRTAVRSNQILEAELRRKFRVSPPTYGVSSPRSGPSVHLVLAANGARSGVDNAPLMTNGTNVHTVLSGEQQHLVGNSTGPHLHTVLARGGGDEDDRALMQCGPHFHSVIATDPGHADVLMEGIRNV